MSVLVKGMKMPSGCEWCGFTHWYPENGNVWCNAANRLMLSGWYGDNLQLECHEWCPLVELPEKHGRLIDANSLENEVCSGCRYKNNKHAHCIDCAIANAPTVIEAEGSEYKCE